jgi:hypothetical protein
MNIRPYDTSIRSLFQSYFLRIPRFQRPYSWDKGNLEEFWSDITGANREGYFIGSMVMYGQKSSQELFVVDGQQRLTTITIMLAAIRDELAERGLQGPAQGIQNVIERQDINADQRFVLLTETSYPFFQEYVQKLGKPSVRITPDEEERGIQSAYKFARDQLTEAIRAIETEHPDDDDTVSAIVKQRLEQTRDILLGIELIVVQLDNESDAYVVFETLNTRGKDLEPKDLVKNLVTKLLPPSSGVDAATIRWREVLDNLAKSASNISPSTYLHHFWLSRHDYTPERTLFDRIKGKVAEPGTANEFLDQLVTDVETYRRIFEPDNFPWTKEELRLQKSLLALAIFRIRQPTPFVLALLRAYFAKIISLKQAADILSAIERFHFLHTAVAGLSSSGGVSMMYAAAARELTSEADAQKRARHLQEFRAKLVGRTPEKDVFNAGISELRYSQAETRNRPLIRYILEKVDLSAQNGVPVDYDSMTIEHIAPQNPVGSDAVEGYASLGNLLLVSEELNARLKNKSFVEKKTILVDSGIVLDPVLREAQQWSGADIAKRTEYIAGLVHGY